MGADRRRALRVPVRGVAVFYGEASATHGTIENLSRTGALVNVTGMPADRALDVELKLGLDSGWVSARATRVESVTRGPGNPRDFRVAVCFDNVGNDIRQAIDVAVASAVRAAQQRPILVIDDATLRRRALVNELAARGMTPLAPRTPLEAIDLLTRAQLHVDVCLYAPSFGVASSDLHALVTHSFPWVTAAEISDDIEDTADRAAAAWAVSDVARMALA